MSYHGNCLGGISLSGNKARVLTYEGIIDSKRFHKVSPCYESRYKKEGETSEEYTQRLLDELEEKITEVGPENIAAFLLKLLLEPLQVVYHQLLDISKEFVKYVINMIFF